VNLIGFTISPYYSLVTEFISFGNLYDYIHDKSKSLTERLYLRCAVDIAKGCAFMHGLRPPIIHRDLKTPNVLMSDAIETAPVVCKVADFGTCQALASTTKGRIVSNPIWLAPEIMKQKEYTEKVGY
jgi:serine/threonine-protein kinase CTR1